LLLLLVNPLFGLAGSWGWGEIPCAVLLLALWFLLRWRGPADLSLPQSAWFAGLAGLLALVRSDLLWVPVLWWLIVGLGNRRRRRAALVRRTLLCAVVGVAILLPWWLHVAQHTGKLFGNPLTDAIQIDLSEPWWNYPHLRSREPIPLGENLRENPGPALHKTAWGVRHFTRTLGDWLPWLFWCACLLLWVHRTWRRRRRGHPLLRAAGPAGLPVLTLPLLMAQYAFFSPETRHMLPLLPLFAWIGVALAAGSLRPRGTRRWIRGAILTAGTGLALWLTPPLLGGEESNVRTARELEQRVAQVAATAAALPPGPVFSDNAAVPWRTDRPCVWSPFDGRVEAEIRQAIPAMASAPWVRILPAQ
jgi:hypothetical protein